MTQQLPDQTDRVPAADESGTHRLAVLALVLAVLIPPVGIVLAVLVLRRTQPASGDGRLAIGALLVAVVVLIGEVVLLIALTTSASTSTTSAAAGSSQGAAAGTTEAGTTPAAGGAATAGGASDPKGVVTACGVVMPALGQVRTDVGKVTSAGQYGEVLTQLANTIVTGAAATTDSTFHDHVGQLSQAFQKAWQDSSNGKAPSAVADELTAAGAPVSRDCAAAGYHP